MEAVLRLSRAACIGGKELLDRALLRGGVIAAGEEAMHSHAELVELAQMCAFNAREATDRRVAEELWKMALEYQAKAAAADSGRKPYIGSPPDFLNEEN